MAAWGDLEAALLWTFAIVTNSGPTAQLLASQTTIRELISAVRLLADGDAYPINEKYLDALTHVEKHMKKRNRIVHATWIHIGQWMRVYQGAQHIFGFEKLAGSAPKNQKFKASYSFSEDRLRACPQK